MNTVDLAGWWSQRFVPGTTDSSQHRSDGRGGPRDRSGNADQIPVLAGDDLPHHVGLWLDRGLPWSSNGSEDKEKHRRRNLYNAAIDALDPGTPARQFYATCLERFGERDPANPHRRPLALTTESRVLLHTASNASVTEGSILLHHTYGVPYLPGSALKGLLRRGLHGASSALQTFWLGEGGSNESDDDQAALFDVHDALWWPEADHESPLGLDIVNPHHSKYYTQGKAAPLESDDPVPTHRLSLISGVRFRTILEFAPNLDVKHVDEFCRFACDAVVELGIGAWTTSGYGRLRAVLIIDDRPSSP